MSREAFAAGKHIQAVSVLSVQVPEELYRPRRAIAGPSRNELIMPLKFWPSGGSSDDSARASRLVQANASGTSGKIDRSEACPGLPRQEKGDSSFACAGGDLSDDMVPKMGYSIMGTFNRPSFEGSPEGIFLFSDGLSVPSNLPTKSMRVLGDTQFAQGCVVLDTYYHIIYIYMYTSLYNKI